MARGKLRATRELRLGPPQTFEVKANRLRRGRRFLMLCTRVKEVVTGPGGRAPCIREGAVKAPQGAWLLREPDPAMEGGCEADERLDQTQSHQQLS